MPGILAWENCAEARGASIATTSEAIGLGIRSVLTPQIADVWRSTSPIALATVDIDIDLGLTRSDLRFFLLAAPRDGLLLTATDSLIRVTASNVAVGGTDALDTGSAQLIMQPNGIYVHLATANVVARWVRFSIRPGTGETYVQLGRVWCGPALVTATSASYGAAETMLDGGASDRAATSGVRYATRGYVRRAAGWTFPLLQAADAAAVASISRAVGVTGQVFASPNVTAPATDGILGSFVAVPRRARTLAFRTSVDISIEEDA